MAPNAGYSYHEMQVHCDIYNIGIQNRTKVNRIINIFEYLLKVEYPF